jgi:hypothetical protein
MQQNDLRRFGQQAKQPETLGARRKFWALTVVAVGLLTFFLPLITTDTVVLGKTKWSVMNLMSEVCSGELPPPSGLAVGPGYLAFLLTLAAPYLLLLYSGIAVLLSFDSLPRRLSVVGCFGVFVAAEIWQWDKGSFEQTFFGGWSFCALPV